MAFITPKTNWKDNYNEEGKYIGDYFDYRDYNRIKNNITEIAYEESLYSNGYQNPEPPQLGTDKTFKDWMGADFNYALEYLKHCCNTCQYPVDMILNLIDNGKFYNAYQLNELEKTCLHSYDRLVNLHNHSRANLSFSLGTRGEL